MPNLEYLQNANYMYVKLIGIGIILFGFYISYVKRHLEDDSLLLGSGLILTGILLFIIGWIVNMDAKRK